MMIDRVSTIVFVLFSKYVIVPTSLEYYMGFVYSGHNTSSHLIEDDE